MKLLITIVIPLVFASTAPFAQVASHQGASAPALQIAQANTLVNAEVRKVDKEQGKLTLAHEPIPNLEMPKMTMIFRVKDPAMLDKVKPGDKIKFSAERVDGQLTVISIEQAK